MARDAMLKQETNKALESNRGNSKSGKKAQVKKSNVRSVALRLKSSYGTNEKEKPLNETYASNVGISQTHPKVKEAKIRRTNLRLKPVHCRKMQVTLQ